MQPIVLRNVVIYLIIALLCIVTNVVALIFQFFYHELPCPLCLLQRFGFIAIGLGAVLNVAARPPVWKYDLIIIISSLYTLIVSLRQVLLHILPHDLGYGSTFLGLHFYTWTVIITFTLIVLMSTTRITHVLLTKISILQSCPYFLPEALKISLIIITFVNAIAAYFECGFGLCPPDPTVYIKW